MEREISEIVKREASDKCVMEIKEIHCMGNALL